MARKDDFMPPQAEVDALLSMAKTVQGRTAKWRKKPPPGRAPLWLETDLPVCDLEGLPVPGLRVHLAWRPPEIAEEEDESFDCAKMSFILFYHSRRICAFDTYPFDRHRNRVGEGWPLYDQSILGPHRHHYVYPHGDGYAEPIGTPPDANDFLAYWALFCATINLTSDGNPTHPAEDESGQMNLL